MQLELFLLTIFLSFIDMPLSAANYYNKYDAASTTTTSVPIPASYNATHNGNPVHVIDTGKTHPLFFQFRKNISRSEITEYRKMVNTYLSHNKTNGMLPHAISVVLQYANFVDDKKVKQALAEETNKYEQLILIRVVTYLRSDTSGMTAKPDFEWPLFFPLNSSLEEITDNIIFSLRQQAKTKKIDKSFSNIKSDATVSFFLNKTYDDKEEEKGLSKLINRSQEQLASVLKRWAAQDTEFHYITSDALREGNNILFFTTLIIGLLKEKEIERVIFFPRGFEYEVKSLDAVLADDNTDENEDDEEEYYDGHNYKRTTSRWGQNRWMLHNYVDQNFALQNRASYEFEKLKGQGEIKADPFYLHSDGFYYLNLGLRSHLKNSLVLLKLKLVEYKEEYRFKFENWAIISENCNLTELLDIVPAPNRQLPKIPKTFLHTRNISYDVENIYRRNKEHFQNALPNKTDQERLDWLKKELSVQIASFQINTAHAELSWYESGNSFSYCLPLFDNKKLVLVAVLGFDQKSLSITANTKFTVVSTILPAWAYNNSRVLGKPKTPWMKSYSDNL